MALLGLAGPAFAQPDPALAGAPLARVAVLSAAVDSLVEAGALGEAEGAAREALRLAEEALGPADTLVAERLNALGRVLNDAEGPRGAEPQFARALAIIEQAPGQPGLAVYLTDLGSARQQLGAYDDARRLFARAIMAYETAGDSVGAGESHYSLALTLFYLGEFAQAGPHYEQALEALEAAHGPDDPDLAYPLTGLARLEHQRGEYSAARALYERAAALREGAYGPDDPAVANDRNDLGWLMVDIGDYAEAERLSERVLAVTESVPGAEVVMTRALYTLGVALARQGRPAEAEAALSRALAVREAALGPDHPTVAQVLDEQAALAERAGDLGRARGLFERAVSIRAAALSPGHPNVAATLDRLAWVEARLGLADSARVHAEQAVRVWRAALGDGHPSTALSQAGLAQILLSSPADSTPDAERLRPERLLMESSAALSAHAAGTLTALSWAEQRAFLEATLRRQTGLLLTAFEGSPALPQAYAEWAGWKGLLLLGLRRQAALTRLGADPARAGEVAALAAVRDDLAGWFERAGTLPTAVWSARNDSLNARKEALERALAGALPAAALRDPLADLLHAGGLSAFQARLPEGTAFVDVYRYGHRVSANSLVSSYAAVVATGSSLSFVPLGRADEVDLAVDAWRTAVVDREDATAAWADLVGRVWAPIAAALPAALHGVWVSPDGLLGRIPWVLLPGPDSGPAVSVVDSARELVALLNRPVGAIPPGFLAVGNVDFGAGRRFPPLPGTGAEVDSLAALAGSHALSVLTLTGSGATTTAVREALPAATYVHLATHGFFDDDVAPPGAPGQWARSPLVESGLAFAGANEEPGAVLTAEALVGIDQSNTELVVLSACKTGLGTEVDGQGVMGLRAAFTTAGARSVLMSLWEVPDKGTTALMQHFYRALWDEGLPVVAALRKAQAEVRSDPRFASPVHWAGWMVVGRGW